MDLFLTELQIERIVKTFVDAGYPMENSKGYTWYVINSQLRITTKADNLPKNSSEQTAIIEFRGKSILTRKLAARSILCQKLDEAYELKLQKDQQELEAQFYTFVSTL